MNYFGMAIFALALLLTLTMLRIFIGPTVWDRLLAFNLTASKIVIAIVLFALAMDKPYLLDVALVYSLLGFVATVFIARFVEQKGNA